MKLLILEQVRTVEALLWRALGWISTFLYGNKTYREGRVDPFYLGLKGQFASSGAMAHSGNMSLKRMEPPVATVIILHDKNLGTCYCEVLS